MMNYRVGTTRLMIRNPEWRAISEVADWEELPGEGTRCPEEVSKRVEDIGIAQGWPKLFETTNESDSVWYVSPWGELY
jgi:hypothetical protein